jgi:hypothetical protein
VITLCLAIAALLIARRAWTQAHQVQRTLELIFVCNACGLDSNDVRKAVLAEAGASEGSSSQGAGVLHLTVDQRHLGARYQTPDRRLLERSIDLPREPSRAVQAIALLAANLVRDEAADLLEELRAKPDDNQPFAVASASVAPPALPPPPAKSPLVTAAAPPPAAAQQAQAPAPMETRLFNLSLWHPVSLYPTSDQMAIYLELGLLYGRVRELRGGALSLGGTEVRRRLDGLSFATVGTVSARTRGGMVALGGNWSRRSLSGLQVAAIANGAGGGSEGMQVAAANLAFARFDGVQFGLINYAAGPYRGAQIGLINIAGRMSGTQLGALNIAADVKGFPVGAVNLNQTGRMQVLTWASTSMLANFGLRYLHRYVYTLLAAGWQPAASSAGGDGYNKVAWQIAVGGHIPAGILFCDVDAGYVHEGAASQQAEIGHTQMFRLRAVWGLQPSEWFGLFAGGGLRREFPAEGSAKTSPEAILGLQLF